MARMNWGRVERERRIWRHQRADGGRIGRLTLNVEATTTRRSNGFFIRRRAHRPDQRSLTAV